MWKAIRLHPWRLEIVPAAAFAFAVWCMHVYQTQAAWFVRAVPELRKKDAFQQMPWSIPSMLVFLWLMQAAFNHRWVQSEKRKRYNWFVLIFQTAIVMYAWFAHTAVALALWFKHPTSEPAPLSLVPLGAMIAGGAAVTALLEWSRRYSPRDEIPEPPLPQSGAYAYGETQVDWCFLPLTPGILALTAGACADGQATAGEIAVLAAIGALAAAVFLSFTLRFLTVTAETVTY
jgi:hypothetical protein